MTDDLDVRTKQLAKDLLEALDREYDPDWLAYTVQKEREDRAALEQFYVRTGQKPAPGEPEDVVAVWDYASRPEATFSIGVLTVKGVARYEYKALIYKLKRLGLTYSLEVGYSISPVRWLGRDGFR